MPNSRLADYFKFKKIDLGIDFDKLKEKDTEIIFNALYAFFCATERLCNFII